MSGGSDPRGIVLLGAPRSGTTLLRRILDAHPNIACPGETGVLRACARFLQQETTGVGVNVGVLAGLRHAGFDEATVLSRLREFAFSFHREIAERAGKRRWMEKNAFDAFHAETIERLCSDEVQYVCLVRHGLDAADSMLELALKSGSFLLEFHDYVARHKSPLEALCHAWVDINGQLSKLVERRPQQAILVKYEDLVANPDSEVEKLLSFLGEPMEEGLVSSAVGQVGSVGLGDWKTYGKTQVDASSVARWQKLPPATQAALATIANPMLQRLGYPEVKSTQDQADDEAAARRYELGLLLQRARAAKKS